MPKLILTNLQYQLVECSTVRRLQVKIENIYVLKKNRLKTSLKTGFAQISLAAQKIWVAHNFGEAAAPPAPPPPARRPMFMLLFPH